MTVQELIDKLEDYDPDFTICDFEGDEITDIEEDEVAQEIILR